MRSQALFWSILVGITATGTIAWPTQAQVANQASARATIEARDTYYLGETPRITIAGLEPDERVTVHLLRVVDRWLPDGSGGWRREPTAMQGWGRFRADEAGRIALATAVPEEGTSKRVGPVTLFWSARRTTDPLLVDQGFARTGIALRDDNTHVLRVARGSDIIAEHRFRINAERPEMTRVEINTPQLSGFFAAPAGARRVPVILHLHGSEGGSTAKARDVAQRYAEAGFATLAINYFAWEYEANGLAVPREHRNTPVELLDYARKWLRARPEADTSRIALVGNSKGGEFAMVGAATYPWVRAAVGCVPSDVVWEGYGATSWNGATVANLPAAGTYSSWSWRGTPLAYIPTYADQRDGFVDNTDRYDRARAQFSQPARAARIPIERTRAQLYLIGGERDRTWASGAMTRSLVSAMDAAGKDAQVESLISPTGGHFLCGDGLYPHRAWQEDNASPFAPDIDAQGQAEFAAYEGKMAFLRRVLMPPRR
jgi:pimeloyl-ACP methyl ester carboxylesterase